MDTWPLRKTGHHTAEGSGLEPNHRYGSVVHFNVGMIQIGPITADFIDWPEEPLQQVKLMRRLVHEYTATLGRPFAAPRIRSVIRFVAPTEHRKGAKDGLANLARVDRGFHSLDR